MTPSQTFDNILNIIATTPGYTIGDFLMEFFGPPPHPERATGRSLRHGKMLGMFMRGTTTFGVGELLWGLHCAAWEFRPNPVDESLWMLDNETCPYRSLKSGYSALTSYAAQKVKDHLQEEQKAATNPHAGLHVFEPRKPGEEEIKLCLSWDTYGATTLADVQAVLEQHQPLTFGYILLLTQPEHHDDDDEFRYRPPNVVREILKSLLPLPTCARFRQKFSAKSTTYTIATRSGYKSSTGSCTTAAVHHKQSSPTQVEWVSQQVTPTFSGPSRS